MTECEKVIKGLACCAHVFKECDECPYKDQKNRHMKNQGGPCTSFLADDALPLLYRQTEADRLYELMELIRDGKVQKGVFDGCILIKEPGV